MVVVIDEAQEFSERDLGELRCLSNAAAGARSAMSIVLVGQPELSARVRSLPAIDTRVGLRYHLRRLEPTDVGAYLAHRLRAAGRSGRAFTDEAVELLAERSGGVPRSMNRIAKLALFAAAARGAPLVGDADVGSVADDIALNAA